MPELGDTARGNDIGKVSNKGYKYVDCIDCGESRWVDESRGYVLRCMPCNIRYQKSTTMRKYFM